MLQRSHFNKGERYNTNKLSPSLTPTSYFDSQPAITPDPTLFFFLFFIIINPHDTNLNKPIRWASIFLLTIECFKSVSLPSSREVWLMRANEISDCFCDESVARSRYAALKPLGVIEKRVLAALHLGDSHPPASNLTRNGSEKPQCTL